MRLTFKATIACLLAVTGCCILAFRKEKIATSETIRQELVIQSDGLLAAIHRLQVAPAKDLQQRFREARLAYKRLEWAVEYFDPLTTRQVNGPPVPETELTGLVIEPDGLQVIEGLLFPKFTLSSQKELAKRLNSLAANATQFQYYFTHANLQDWQILDALKQEIFRVEILGLNDFDDPLARQCFAESAAALQSTQKVVLCYQGIYKLQLPYHFQQAIHYLSRSTNFDQFDRAAFIINYANPLTRALTKLHKQLHLPDIRYNRLLKQDTETLFDRNAFNRNAYIAAPEDSATVQKIALGKKLFFDPQLSGNGMRSCGSCHQPDKAFTDGLAKNLDLKGKRFLTRNTPTLINAALQPSQFYDMRAASLEDQAHDVMSNKDEMHGDMQISTGKLWKDAEYRKLFKDAFPVIDRKAIDTAEIMNVLASYVRSLTELNSRFDVYMRGDNSALNQSEIRGFNLFMGKARCATCHYLPLFNGSLPPRYMQMDAEVIGVPKTKAGKAIDPDEGLYGISPFAFNHHSFKVTAVRNAARTAPYMHNGVYKSLEEVIDFYNKGGGAGIGLNVPNQTLATGKLNLTAAEKKQLIAFIKSLDSR
ncbi:cytochrome c peroxidase [Mucilaginibacter sp. UYCu711]|uniref:cytochrome c peroxidase n=1 Tax=Mucilaginibacter sp. UYCu711 TaxID=3156339 RepID=UPI003D1E0C19